MRVRRGASRVGFGEGGVLRLGVIASGRTSALATLALTSALVRVRVSVRVRVRVRVTIRVMVS